MRSASCCAAGGEQTGESFTIFRAVPVFDIAQTDGDPLPQAPREPITGDSHEHYIATLEAFAGSLGYTVGSEAIEHAGGYCDERAHRIVISSAITAANSRVRVLVHELSHALGVGYAGRRRQPHSRTLQRRGESEPFIATLRGPAPGVDPIRSASYARCSRACEGGSSRSNRRRSVERCWT